MEHLSFNATMIVIPGTAKPPSLGAADNHWAEQTKPASILHVRFYNHVNVHNREFQVVYDEPIEEYSVVDQKYTGWKLATAWTGVIVGSWALVIGCVMIARALLP